MESAGLSIDPFFEEMALLGARAHYAHDSPCHFPGDTSREISSAVTAQEAGSKV